jgi:hypothetical protein
MEMDNKKCYFKFPPILRRKWDISLNRFFVLCLFLSAVFICITFPIFMKTTEMNVILKILFSAFVCLFYLFFWIYTPIMYLVKMESRNKVIFISPLILKEKEVSVTKINKIELINVGGVLFFIKFKGKPDFTDFPYFLPMTIAFGTRLERRKNFKKSKVEEFVKCINEWILKEKETITLTSKK